MAQNFSEKEERKKEEEERRIGTNHDFATRRFRTLAVPLTHVKNQDTVAIMQKRQVSLHKA